jgi:NAD(P)-dependent dehydrogenase (short-subunit alcohol dehydrogenase family)
MRLKDRVAIIVGAGQRPGETMGNGRATALTFAREGARVACVDRDLASAEETAALVAEAGGEAWALAADVAEEAALEAMVADTMARSGRIDILHNNVGISIAGGDTGLTEITADAFDTLYRVNYRGMALACKHALPVMRAQGSGVILTISSMAARAAHPTVGYQTTKAAVVSLTEHIASQNARFGIRANCILPGLMDTPMAVETRMENTGRSRDQIVAERSAAVPLKGGMGDAWDVANAALFLASDEAKFITGVALPVDGGASVNLQLGSRPD